MSIEEFNKRSDWEQFDLVFTEGTYIMNYITPEERCNLYSLNNFFVEIHNDPISNSIFRETSFCIWDLIK